MVFSFFKKDPKDNAGRGKGSSRSSSGVTLGRSSTKPQAKSVGKPLGRPLPDGRSGSTSPRSSSTLNAMPNRELARSLAMETAAKIDAIESEMARDFLRPAANTGSPARGPSTAGRGPAPAVAPARVQSKPAPPPAVAAFEDDSLGGPTDAFLASVDAIELDGASGGSVIDETAILFANGQPVEAEETLRQGIDNVFLGHSEALGWRMLFELVNQRGDRSAFEQLVAQHALRFDEAPPGWVDYGATAPIGSAPAAPVLPAAPAVIAPAAASGPGIELPAVVDGSVVKALETLKLLAAQHSALVMDASAVRSIDLPGAELLLRVVNAFKRSNHELTILGCEQLVEPLRTAVESGRRDPSDAAWMLLLEVLCLLGRHHDFEETAIQYCITFEVSPPSWEAPSPSLKVGAATPRMAAAAPVAPVAVMAPPPVSNALEWRGVIDGEGEPHFSRLANEARGGQPLVVDCRYLKRMGFATGSALLTLVTKLQTGGVTVELRNVNPLVVALLNLLGVTAVASVQPRRP